MSRAEETQLDAYAHDEEIDFDWPVDDETWDESEVDLDWPDHDETWEEPEVDIDVCMGCGRYFGWTPEHRAAWERKRNPRPNEMQPQLCLRCL